MARYILCYDISDDRERLRVEKVAKRFGLRLQKSVYWCALENGTHKAALEEALRKLNPRSGCVLLIPAPNWDTVNSFGELLPDNPASTVLVLI